MNIDTIFPNDTWIAWQVLSLEALERIIKTTRSYVDSTVAAQNEDRFFVATESNIEVTSRRIQGALTVEISVTVSEEKDIDITLIFEEDGALRTVDRVINTVKRERLYPRQV